MTHLPLPYALQVVIVVLRERVSIYEERTPDRSKAPIRFGEIVVVSNSFVLLGTGTFGDENWKEVLGQRISDLINEADTCLAPRVLLNLYSGIEDMKCSMLGGNARGNVSKLFLSTRYMLISVDALKSGIVPDSRWCCK